MNVVIRLKRATAAEWAAVNPVLKDGEMGWDTTNRSFKVGDGVTPWSGLTLVAFDTETLTENINAAVQAAADAQAAAAQAEGFGGTNDVIISTVLLDIASASRAAVIAVVDDEDFTPVGAWDFSGATVTGIGAGSGVSDHGDLTGLADDDHPQYFNQTRGDSRYFTQAQITSQMAGKAAASHTHDVTDLNVGGTPTGTKFLRDDGTWATTPNSEPAAHTHDDRYYTENESDALHVASRARANHTGTQVAATISDLTEAVGDILSSVLVAGSGISVSYDDPSGQLNIAATGNTGPYRPALRVYEDTGVVPARSVVTSDVQQPVEIILELGSTTNPYDAAHGYIAGFDTVGKTVLA